MISYLSFFSIILVGLHLLSFSEKNRHIFLNIHLSLSTDEYENMCERKLPGEYTREKHTVFLLVLLFGSRLIYFLQDP